MVALGKVSAECRNSHFIITISPFFVRLFSLHSISCPLTGLEDETKKSAPLVVVDPSADVKR